MLTRQKYCAHHHHNHYLRHHLGERGGAGRHEYLAHAVVELGEALLIDTQEALRRALLGDLVLQVPHAVAVRELLVLRAALRQNAALEAAHVEQQVGIVLAIDTDETGFPLDSGDRTGKAVLDVPKHGATTMSINRTSTWRIQNAFRKDKVKKKSHQ